MLCKQKSTCTSTASVLIVLALCTATAHADGMKLQVHRADDSILVSMVLHRSERPNIIESLDKGLRSEISYEIKIYQETSGLRSIFGDRLIWEEHIHYEGKRDNFSNDYQLVSDSGTRRFSEPEVFLEHYYELKNYSIPFSPVPGEDYYLLGRIVVEDIKLVPPLNLLTLFMRENRTVTDWHRHPIDGEKGV